ncbi:MAG TPA: (d)CMP kinase [Jatrophihabitantaceae bacterium]
MGATPAPYPATVVALGSRLRGKLPGDRPPVAGAALRRETAGNVPNDRIEGDVTPDTGASPAGDDDGPRLTGVVALDGPSGTGKSTVARMLARRLGARYLDTGAMYRAATLAVLSHDVDPADQNRVVAAVRSARIALSTDPERAGVELDGRPVDAEIRSAAVTAAVSAVSAVPEVRAVLVEQQRRLIGAGPIVVEGRDIGSVVVPDAQAKVYLTASAQARAARRASELGPDVDVAAVAADLQRRDRLDSTRAVSPLARAADAVDVDTTDLSIDEVVDRLVDIVLNRAASRSA